MPRETLRHRVARIRSTFRDLHALPGLAFVFVVSGAWYAAAYATRGDAFLETHALRENVFRVLDAERFSSGHSHGVFYLLGQFFLGQSFFLSSFTPSFSLSDLLLSLLSRLKFPFFLGVFPLLISFLIFLLISFFGDETEVLLTTLFLEGKLFLIPLSFLTPILSLSCCTPLLLLGGIGGGVSL